MRQKNHKESHFLNSLQIKKNKFIPIYVSPFIFYLINLILIINKLIFLNEKNILFYFDFTDFC
ncbi:MAG TPA: hypothetical protein DEP28_12445 [Bacteroidetes bacterium]|nr:hypothetical protein [Bacteroidota bacterium]